MSVRAAESARAVFHRPGGNDWYPLLLGPSTLAARATSPGCLRAAVATLARLERDDYLDYTLDYYREGLARFGDSWRYADLVTVLQAAAELAQPRRYLEIGVRRGRSLAIVAAASPECDIAGFDLWVPDYAGMPNPGPDFVRREAARVGHRGTLELLGGDSGSTVPRYLAGRPEAQFDLVTVDGDHSPAGAERDLEIVLPRLTVGGVVVFDDIAHPGCPGLADVWRERVASNPAVATWEYTELGFGVALGVRTS